jgi:DNA invertase Pin-like site-specific DNA recombinase
LQHLNRLSSYGVGFRSFTEPYLDSCGIFKDAVIAILGTIAKQERVRISERVRAGLSRARSEGTKSGKPIGRPELYSHATRPVNCEFRVGLGAGSHGHSALARRVYAGLVSA